MNKEHRLLSPLYIKISITFLVLLVAIGIVYVIIVFSSVNKYYQEANQKLNATIAEHIVSEIQPFVNGEVNKGELEKIFHNTMVLNPAIEIYLLNSEGEILSFFAPGKVVKLKKIALEPIDEFIRTKGQEFVCAPDPRNPDVHKVFSAAEVREKGVLKGYIYVVLAGEDYDSIIELLKGSFYLRLGILSFGLTLLAAILIGFLIIWSLTRNLQVIVDIVKDFAKGDMKARIKIKTSSEFIILANTFNEMADSIVSNMDKLKAMEKLKSELIANISHDLRTPLSVIHGYIETLTLKEDKISLLERRRYMRTVLKNTEKLEKLVADLFEISKLDSLQIQPNKEPFFVPELISDILSKYHLQAKEKNIEIIHLMAPNVKRVYADLSMMDRVLQNLIDNAFKFTPEGGSITIQVQNKDNTSVEIKISDTGIGISPEVLPYIFNRFYTSGRNSEGGGSGLGLAIVKKIIEIHNSDILVSSTEGKGTSFTFWLDIYDNPFLAVTETNKEAFQINLISKAQTV